MKFRIDQLAGHLRKASLAGVYMVSGEEPLVVQEACDDIRQSFRKAGFTEREVHHAERGFDWGTVLQSANSLSLFAEKKLIEIRLSGSPGEAGAAALMAFLEHAGDDTAILVVAGKLDANAQRSKWFTALEKKIIWVQVWPVTRKDLPGWIAKRLKSAGLKADQSVINILCDRIEGNLLAAAQEIERMKLLVSDGTLTSQHVLDDVADSTRYDVFKVIDTALSGNPARTLKMLSGLKSQGVDVLSLLGLMALELRSLAAMSILIKKGQPIDAVMGSARVWFNRKAVVGKALRVHTYEGLVRLLEQLTVVDSIAKHQQEGNAWNALEDIFLVLAGHGSPVQVPREFVR